MTKTDDKPSVQDQELATLLTQVTKGDDTTNIAATVVSATRIATVSDQDKSVPTPDQNTRLQNSLSSKTLMNDMEDLFANKADTKTIQHIADTINSIAKAFSIEVQAKASLDSINKTSTELAVQLEKKYFLSPSSIKNLKAIAAWMTYIQKQTAFADTDSANKARKELVNNVPSELRFQ